MTEHGPELTLDLARQLGPGLAARIAGLGEQAPADLTAANLWLFRRAHRWRLHEGAWPCLSGVAYDGQAHAFPLFEPSRAPAGVLHELIARHGCLFPLTARDVAALDGQRFRIGWQRDDSDYVYPAEQFRSYGLRALRKKRNLAAQFAGRHSMAVQPYEPVLLPDALAVLEGWLRDKGKAPGQADDEPCREALALAQPLGLQGFLYRADGEPAGFLLAEELQPGVWVIRFAKGLARYAGLAPAMFQHFAQAAPRPAAWLNFENDLGLANFRRTKLSYRPTLLLRKWRVSQFPQDG
jgi:hypothetical protein